MLRFWWFLLLSCAILVQIVQSQRRRQITHYSSHSPVAQDRRFNWIKYLKKQERRKFRRFKKYFQQCGISPFKFKIFRRSDDGDLDTIHIMVPNGYKDEYFPKPEVGEEEVVPVEYYRESTTNTPIYSVKYRAVGAGNYWRPNGNGTIGGTAINSSTYDLIMG